MLTFQDIMQGKASAIPGTKRTRTVTQFPISQEEMQWQHFD